MYTTSVHTNMNIDSNGTRIKSVDICVDGYRDSQRLNEMGGIYTKNITQDEFQRECNDNGYLERTWRKHMWDIMFYQMRYRLGRWKNKRI
ncbi:MAG: hypothetical protein KJ697_01175 [Nanoarchaeota archaeon]|nr:hypothetical protein [Nanoarchaeota archaeon]MBU4123858.1 hypothetical protein [Nanoarchaeota archaeon]